MCIVWHLLKDAVRALRNRVAAHSVDNGFTPAVNRSALQPPRCDMGDFLGAMSMSHFFAHKLGCGSNTRC